jgi:hypothetical protein
MKLFMVAQRALPCLRWQGEDFSFDQAPDVLACAQDRLRAAERARRMPGGYAEC